MPIYTEQSLESLRQKIDLVEVLSSHVDLKRQGATYKACCPFHEEKTPSFVVKPSDTHYHCFGCGAHGDAIAFLMRHLNLSFTEAIESLAERFGVFLDRAEGEQKGPRLDKKNLKACLETACSLYHTLLLHTEEGHKALEYLYRRGIDLPFIKRFRLGYAPHDRNLLLTFAKKEGFTEETLRLCGLLTERGRDFFFERIQFPITDPFGAVIGFSGRKMKEETFGGKYINTPETPLFKKSHTLFGLSYCRQKIAKEKQVLVVEGQIDALQLIHHGFEYAVAAQGTAFGASHVKLLTDLGVTKTYLVMDADEAGKTAALKVGHFFLQKGVSVCVVQLPPNTDPDSFLQTHGPDAFQTLLENSIDYLTFLVETNMGKINPQDPAQKNLALRKMIDQIRSLEEPILVHELLRKLAQLTQVPESVVGVGGSTTAYIPKSGKAGRANVDPNFILETDLLRWLLLMNEPRLGEITTLNVTEDLFHHPLCKKLFLYWKEKQTSFDLISAGSYLETEQEQSLLATIVEKKINTEKAEEGLVEVIHRLLIRKWMEEREAIRQKIQQGTGSEQELLKLAKAFDEVKKHQPTVVMP